MGRSKLSDGDIPLCGRNFYLLMSLHLGREPLWIRLDGGVPTEFKPQFIKVFRHHFPSNPRWNEQVAAISGSRTLGFETPSKTGRAVHDATSL
jgi:hypothetical protein